jgi:hypothetical protein
MTTYARVSDGVVAEILHLPAGFPMDAFANDFAASLKEVPAKVKQGWVVDGGGFKSPPEPEPAGPSWDAIRLQRDERLRQSDWTMLSDSPLTKAQKTEWAAYRQALRDIPQDVSNPAEVDWPASPS